MLCVTFRIGKSRYCVGIADVEEILPPVKSQAIPSTPDFVAGMIDYRGEYIPMIDLKLLIAGVESEIKMNCRIIAIRATFFSETRKIALLVENLSDVLEIDEESAVLSALALERETFFGKIVYDEEGLIQEIIADKIITGKLKELLFKPV